jgi:AcrR family transcriptional regulator
MNQRSNTKVNKKEMLRWGHGIRANPDFAHEQILNAALACFQKYSLQETCMGKIAQEAKVTRTTIYRHFQSRNEVLLELIFRELYRVLDKVQNQIPTESSFAEFVVETLVVTDEEIRLSPIFELIVTESAMLMERIYGYGDEMLEVTAVHFRPRFDIAKAAGELQPDIEYEEFISWLYHIGASLILIPSDAQTSRQLRPMLWRYLIPAIIKAEHLQK